MSATRITKASLVAELEVARYNEAIARADSNAFEERLASAHAEIARLEALLERPAPAASRPVAVKPIVTWFTKADGSVWRKERIGNNARLIPVARVGA